MPAFEQLFLAAPAGPAGRPPGLPPQGLSLDRLIYPARKRIEHATAAEGVGVYFTSLSSRTLVYKGMLTTGQLGPFFPDLSDERMDSAIAVVHSRFSTNTFPAWPLAHPYRFIAHNGEINTVRGNRNRMRAREALLASDLIPGDLARAFPICTPDASDSATFDEVLELLHLAGRSLPHAVLMMIPEAWQNNHAMNDDIKAFAQFHASLIEPWDGPACVTFTDGTLLGAVLDRNGLRPGRWWQTADGRIVLASEAGVLPIAPQDVIRRGRLQPGRMFLVDTAAGRIVEDSEIKSKLAAAHPYRDWVDAGLLRLARPAAREHVVAVPPRRPPPPATVRLHRGGASGPAHPDGDHRRRGHRVRWVRHPRGRAVGAAAAAVRLLHPAVRPGHQPAAGRDPGGGRHLHGERGRTGGQPAGADAGVLPADPAAVPGAGQR